MGSDPQTFHAGAGLAFSTISACAARWIPSRQLADDNQAHWARQSGNDVITHCTRARELLNQIGQATLKVQKLGVLQSRTR